jgi:hypothetical protein
MYLNTRHGKDFLRTHEFYRKTFVKIISRTSREHSKNIKKAYKNCLAIEREYNKQMKKSKKLNAFGMFLKIKHGEMKTERDMVGNHRRIAEMWSAMSNEEKEKYKKLARQENESNGIE